jgi:hypothetical protein
MHMHNENDHPSRARTVGGTIVPVLTRSTAFIPRAPRTKDRSPQKVEPLRIREPYLLGST